MLSEKESLQLLNSIADIMDVNVRDTNSIAGIYYPISDTIYFNVNERCSLGHYILLHELCHATGSQYRLNRVAVAGLKTATKHQKCFEEIMVNIATLKLIDNWDLFKCKKTECYIKFLIYQNEMLCDNYSKIDLYQKVDEIIDYFNSVFPVKIAA